MLQRKVKITHLQVQPRANIAEELSQLRRDVFFYGSILGSISMAIFTVLQVKGGEQTIYIVQDIIVFIAFVISSILSRQLKNLIWLMRISAVIIMASFFMNIISGGVDGVGIYWTFLFPVIVFTFFTSREAIVWCGIYLAFFLIVTVNRFFQPFEGYHSYTQLWSATSVIVILAIVSFLRQRFIERGRDALLATEKVAIEKSEELKKFKLATDSAYDHIVITDPDGIILYVNEAATRITGYTHDEIIGTKAGKKWSLPMPKGFYEDLWYTIKIKKKVYTGELQNRRKNGEIYDALASISPILDEKKNVAYFVGIERDITREKQIDKAKTEFVSLASHQLRTPLSAINWFTEMLINGDAGKVNAQQKEYLREVYNGSRRMVALVNALLNVSRIDMGTFAIEPRPTKIQDIATIAIKDLKQQLKEKHISLVKEVSNKIPVISLDPNLVLIILQNLLSNAVKYTPNKGVITLRIVRNTKILVIEVRDTGYGIAEPDKEKIFQKLFRADNVRERVPDGTGLGLYVVKSIIEHCGGNISFTSKLGKGSTFRAILPASGMQKKPGTKGLTI
jgi:PAS domain S-box-containing protein